MEEVTYDSSLLKDSWGSNDTVKPNNFNELSGAVKKVVANANDLAHNYLQQDKQSVVGDIVYSKNLNKGCYLLCTQGGTTGDSEPQLINKNVGETVTDGSVTWTVQNVSNALSFAGKEADLFALLNSPDFKGTPTAPTAAKTVNNTQIATTAFVHLLAGAANNGGIVDSLLAQNGYIKFANGLIMQWGTTTTSGPTATIVYPVPLNQVLYVSYSPIDAATYVGTGSITSTSMGIYRIWYNDTYPAAGSTTFFVIGI